MTHLLEIYLTNCFIQQSAFRRVVNKKETVKIIPRVPNTDFLIDQYKCKYFFTFFTQAQDILVISQYDTSARDREWSVFRTITHVCIVGETGSTDTITDPHQVCLLCGQNCLHIFHGIVEGFGELLRVRLVTAQPTGDVDVHWKKSKPM